MDNVMGFQPAWRAFALGGLPPRAPEEAWQAVNQSMIEIPHWPQLPSLDSREGPYAQWSEGFPGVSLTDDLVRVVRGKDLDRGLEQLYMAYLEDDLDYFRVGGKYASGLYALTEGSIKLPQETMVLKGQIAGPISWGLCVVDENRRSLLYDQVLGDVVAKHIRLKASWQERQLRRFCARTMIMVQEPYMSSLGSSFISITRHQIIAMLQEVFSGIKGLKGIHCCGVADWGTLMDAPIDIISLDAFEYGLSLEGYVPKLNDYMERGGMIAWGIVPASTTARECSAEALADRLETLIDRLANRGADRSRLTTCGFVTPACSLGALSTDLSEHILRLTAAVSRVMRERHVVSSVTNGASLSVSGSRI